MLELLVTTQVLEPGEYLKNALTGEVEDEGLWGRIKFTAAFVQMVTGNPAYTATEALEESIQSITESCKTCGKILNALMSITPEEWAAIRQQVEEGIAGAVEQEVAETVSLQQELASLTPEEWKELAVRVCKYTYEWQENLVQDFFSEENMKDVYYGIGYGEGTLIMLYLESVIGAELAGKLGGTSGVGAVDDIANVDNINGEQISDVTDDILPNSLGTYIDSSFGDEISYLKLVIL